jgi:hypothetical protein
MPLTAIGAWTPTCQIFIDLLLDYAVLDASSVCLRIILCGQFAS